MAPLNLFILITLVAPVSIALVVLLRQRPDWHPMGTPLGKAIGTATREDAIAAAG